MFTSVKAVVLEVDVDVDVNPFEPFSNFLKPCRKKSIY